MPPTREKMRPWLERQINSNTVSGLNWINKEKNMFSIPWKHAARHGWTMDQDASLFKMWAIHTGKYVAGQKCNPKIWKANFRCALHSLPDVEEVKDRSIQKGHAAARVYRMLPQARTPTDIRRKNTKTKSKRKIKKEEADPDYEPSYGDSAPTQENTVHSTVHSTVHHPHHDLKMMDESEVPDVSFMVEVGTYKLEVSPAHSPDSSYYDFNDIIVTISQPVPLERDPLKMGFSVNEPRTSPGSQWSEESSGGDIDSLYTSLTPSLSPPAELWSTTPPLTLFTL
ncbi:hypothetical protein NL108_005296 [Boleophthalmus pectinirostris]|uniref:interferon regulatory factor 2-like n=1 Tax=Boleophthalmus pectinirostris TaxID=150288 RepID=UPI0024311E4E|nr:interferon regulatory factor 2-like [Boleophthalmus pectinirostris]XP_055004404.1 interferon regulatory factor 2-like [Boleophthalmus pectinirostris]XP_055004406.1 interferon regulatory factor 2-like [Boleophthalmus pectinirostris]KAJ0061482.1 hypothetical protein NL108_005296 [Boleophthalmus pectinirostris]